MEQTRQVKVNRRFRVVREVPPEERGKRKVTHYYDANKDKKVAMVAGQAYKPDWQRVEKEVPHTKRLFDVQTRMGSIVRLNEDQMERLGMFDNPTLIDVDTGELIPDLVSVGSVPLSVKKGPAHVG